MSYFERNLFHIPKMRIVVCILYFAISTSEKKLPEYITMCKAKDPNANDCYVKQANIAIPHFAKGVPELNIPVLDPFHIDEISISPSAGLQAKFTDAYIYGLAGAKSISSNAHVFDGWAEMTVFVPNLVAAANYDIQGQILFLPITGNGKANMTLENVTVVVHNDLEFLTKDGETYLHSKDMKMSYEVMRVRSHLENLFGGNKELGDQMNKFINEHWREYSKDIEPAVCDVLSDIVENIVNNFVSSIPCMNVLDVS